MKMFTKCQWLRPHQNISEEKENISRKSHYQIEKWKCYRRSWNAKKNLRPKSSHIMKIYVKHQSAKITSHDEGGVKVINIENQKKKYVNRKSETGREMAEMLRQSISIENISSDAEKASMKRRNNRIEMLQQNEKITLEIIEAAWKIYTFRNRRRNENRKPSTA